MSLTRLAQHLRNSKEAVMARWQEAVCRDPGRVPSAQGLVEPLLRNHLPVLLDEIADAIAGASAPAIELHGREHGRQRWGSGYDIGEVLHELSLLRHTLLQAVEAYTARVPAITRDERLDAMQRILEVIDRSAHAGVVQFHAEALTARRLLEAELEAANEQKDRFLAMLSHELRNPLSSILNAVQLLELTESDDPRLRRAREVIERQVHHQTRLVDDLLDVSRIARGKVALRLAVHDLKEAVTHAAEGCLPAIQAKQQELHVELLTEPLHVDADPVRMEQVVTNLLTNATRYTHAGGDIWLTVLREGGSAALRVRDNGIGIASELLPHVFDLFRQSDSSTARSHGGLGIGLTLVKSLVELHGGSVEAHSGGPGQGSEFVVRMPLADATVLSPPILIGPSGRPSSKRRVALVEDDRDNREVMAEVLELLGHQVLSAANATEVLELARENPPEAFVVDIGLPGMDGYQVGRRLRQMLSGQPILLIALTGYGTPEEKERAREAGFDAHLTKPANIDELQRLLTQ